MEQRRQGLNASVWCDVEWKNKATHLEAPTASSEDAEDGEEYMCGLAEEIAQSMLEENDQSWTLNDSFYELPDSASWGTQVLLSTSPQSTLAGMHSWDVLSPGASSNCGTSSGVSSPPTPVDSSQRQQDEEHALDLLYAELLRLKVEDELKVRQQQLIMQLEQQQHYQQLLWKLRQREESRLGTGSAFEVLKKAQSIAQYNKCSSNQVPSSASGYSYRSKSRADKDFNQSRSGSQLSGIGGGYAPLQSMCNKAAKSSTPVDQSTRQRHPQYSGGFHSTTSQHSKSPPVNGSGMRAVFLGIPGARESGGTGVFLPRRVGSSHELKRKPACSTVLLPTRIVQALNLNVEGTLACSTNSTPLALGRGDVSGSHAPARVRSLAASASLVNAESSWGRGAAVQEVAPDVCLPREWTY